jgi:PAS domain S-box-containing protein
LLQSISAEVVVRRNLVPICVVRDRLLFMNGRCAALLGYPDDGFPKGLSLHDVVAAADRSRVAHSLRQAILKPGSDVALRFSAVRVDGSIADLELTGTVVAARGEVCVVAAVSDITERVREDARLNYLAFNDGLTGLNRRFSSTACSGRCPPAAPRKASRFWPAIWMASRPSTTPDSRGRRPDSPGHCRVLRSCCRDTAARIGGDESRSSSPAFPIRTGPRW